MSDEAAKREATDDGSPLTIEWEGFTFRVPATLEEWDIDALEALETGKAVTAIRMILGSKVYDQLRVDFQAAKGRKLSVGDVKALTSLIGTTYGLGDEGNS